eukprot:6355646-Amphidinium_carterae.2
MQLSGTYTKSRGKDLTVQTCAQVHNKHNIRLTYDFAQWSRTSMSVTVFNGDLHTAIWVSPSKGLPLCITQRSCMHMRCYCKASRTTPEDSENKRRALQ